MALFYLIIGIILLFTSTLDNFFNGNTLKIVVGSLFGIYGIFRIFRSWNRIRCSEPE
jgi:hypothetical protein